jgi:predicted nucleic acid-binding protein
MNGNVEQFVFDTNVIIRFLDGKIDGLPAGKRFVSVITEMELLAFAGLTAKDEYNIRDFLRRVIIFPLTDAIKDEAIRIRRFGSPRLKLPDAIIMATAVMGGKILVTDDADMLNLNWSGLTVFPAISKFGD